MEGYCQSYFVTCVAEHLLHIFGLKNKCRPIFLWENEQGSAQIYIAVISTKAC